MPFGAAFQQAAAAAGEAVIGGVRAVGAAAVNATTKVAELSAAAARKAAAVGIVGGTAVAGAGVGAAGYGAAKAGQLTGKVVDGFAAVKEKFWPHQPVAGPCMKCLDTSTAPQRKERIEKRNALIQSANASNDPEARKKAERLRDDMKAVEMARLSDNVYAQHDPGKGEQERKPPEPWKALTPEEARRKGVDPALLEQAKATVYVLPPDFPYDPKTVVAFRGTTGETGDILADHDQALGMENSQYAAARALGAQVHDAFPDAEVTGHSLGGGKAQAAGVAGGLHGEMFNSAGLHPNSVGMTPQQVEGKADLFKQYRAEGGLAQGGGDPLTGLQNSPAAQAAAYRTAQGLQAVGRAEKWAAQELGLDPLAALPQGAQETARGLAERILDLTPQQAARNKEFSGGKWYVPPAIGEVRGVTSRTPDGENSPIASQHSITNLVYGIEYRKAADIEALLQDTGQPGPASDYIGPVVMR